MFQYVKDQNVNIYHLETKQITLLYFCLINILTTTRCNWITGSAFNTSIPVDVNKKFIAFI